MFSGPAGNAGNECADIAASLGKKDLLSESNDAFFGWIVIFLVRHLLDVPHRLTSIAEVLLSVVVPLQFECPLVLSRGFFL